MRSKIRCLNITGDIGASHKNIEVNHYKNKIVTEDIVMDGAYSLSINT